MRQWEPQPLPGILEDDASVPLPMPFPSEALEAITEALKQVQQVTIPDFLDADPINAEIHAMLITFETWELLIQLMKGKAIRKALVR